MSFAAPAAPCHRLSGDLSAAMGILVEVDSAVGAEVLLLKVKDRPVREVLDKVSSALSAEWKLEDGKIVLERTPHTLAKLEAESTARIAETFRKGAERALKQGKPLARLDNQHYRGLLAQARQLLAMRQGGADEVSSGLMDRISAGLPRNRVVAELAAALDPVEVAKNGRRPWLRFSSQPRKMFRPFPARSILSQFERQENAWREFLSHNLGADEVSDSYKTPLQGPLQAIVTVETYRDYSPTTFYADVEILDATGKTVVSDRIGILEHDPFASVDDVKPALRGELIPLSEEARAFARLARPDGPFVLNGPLTSKFMRPDLYEPIAFLTSEVVAKTLGTKSENYACCLTDDYVFQNHLGDNEETILRPLAEAEIDLRAKTIRDGDWTILKPHDPYEAQLTRISRPLYRDVLFSSLEDPAVTLREQLSLFERLSDAPHNVGDGMYGDFGQYNEAVQNYNLRVGALVEAVAGSDEAKLRRGVAVPFGSLPSGARAKLEANYYGRQGVVVEGPAPDPAFDDAGRIISCGGFFESFTLAGILGTDLEFEESAAMYRLYPDGIPSNTLVQVQLLSRPTFLLSNEEFSSVTLREIAEYGDRMKVSEATLLPATEYQLFLTLNLPGPSHVRDVVSLDYADKSRKPMTYASFMSRYGREIEHLKKQIAAEKDEGG